MRGLIKSELAKVKNWDNIKLLNKLERYNDRKVLIGIQNTNGVNHKDVTDPDVKELHDTVDALYEEAKKRLNNNPTAITTLDQLLESSADVARGSARGALGIPYSTISDAEVAQAKTGFNLKRSEVETMMGE